MSPDSLAASTAARSEPTASSTATASAAQSSSVGGDDGEHGSDSPTPRRSKRIKRVNAASRRRQRARCGSSAIMSTGMNPSVTMIRSIGPSPSTWYAMYTSPLRAYRVSAMAPAWATRAAVSIRGRLGRRVMAQTCGPPSGTSISAVTAKPSAV